MNVQYVKKDWSVVCLNKECFQVGNGVFNKSIFDSLPYCIHCESKGETFYQKMLPIPMNYCTIFPSSQQKWFCFREIIESICPEWNHSNAFIYPKEELAECKEKIYQWIVKFDPDHGKGDSITHLLCLRILANMIVYLYDLKEDTAHCSPKKQETDSHLSSANLLSFETKNEIQNGEKRSLEVSLKNDPLRVLSKTDFLEARHLEKRPLEISKTSFAVECNEMGSLPFQNLHMETKPSSTLKDDKKWSSENTMTQDNDPFSMHELDHDETSHSILSNLSSFFTPDETKTTKPSSIPMNGYIETKKENDSQPPCFIPNKI